MSAGRADLRMTFLTLAGLATGCSGITDADRFDVCGGGRVRLDANFEGFEEFAAARIEALVTEAATGQVFARAVLEGLHPRHDAGGDEFTILMPCAVPSGDFELRVFVDEDQDGAYTPPGAGGDGDLAFQVPIGGDGSVFIDRQTSPQADISENLDAGGLQPFLMNFRNMSPHTPGEQRLELRVVDVTPEDGDAPFVVGYHRIGDISEADFPADVPTSIADGRRYRIDFFADLSDNGQYDDPPADHSWVEPQPPADGEDGETSFPGGGDGLITDFAHRGAFDPLDF